MSGSERVVKVEGFELRCRMPTVAGNALRVFNERAVFLVKLTTASGAVGWGETWAYPGPASALVKTALAPIVLGADVTNPRALQARMLKVAVPDRRGQAHMAVSAVDIAMWDAFGHVAGKPIHALLGGALRDKIMTYASGPLLPAGEDRYAGFADEVTRYAETGFRAVKIRIGASIREDLRVIREARSILGRDVFLMADLNESSNVRDAVLLAHAASDADLGWLEEPVSHDNLPAYKRLSELLPVPLAGGESFCGVQAFRDILCDGSLDLVQPDLALCGGITEGMRIAGLADAFEVPVAPHVWGSCVNFLASLQFAAVLSPRQGRIPFPLFEYDMSFNPLRALIYDPKPDAQGNLAIPDGPGLGVDIDIGRFADHVKDHWMLEF
ncbi:mandelate racemase/muconate lactonizing enzyme family protein [Pseudomonas sp. R2.Fl]|nr:mandelate racemase/muconate lactonizing enzyme family protein [Pseudomonas sp. R2.Fl]